MASTVLITLVDSNGTTQDMKQRLLPQGQYALTGTDGQVPELLINQLQAMSSGSRWGSIDLQIDGGDAVAASGTVTFTGVGQANDTILINGVTFTAVASGATGNQWNVGGTVTLSAASLKAAINASASALVSGQVSADNVAGVLTITALVKGVTGNAITIAEGVDGTSAMTVSGARLTGGAAATANLYKFGI